MIEVETMSAEATKAAKKAIKMAKLTEEVEEFIAGHDLCCNHPLYEGDIFAAFPDVKQKKLKKILKELWWWSECDNG